MAEITSKPHFPLKRPRALVALACAFLLTASGCASFRGPGEYRPTEALKPNEGVEPGQVADSHEDEPEGGIPVVPGSGHAPPSVLGTPQFDWPLDEARMTRGFITRGRGHFGLDLANVKGTQIVAAERGVVIYTGREFKGYGKLVVIEHNDEWASLYAHLDKIVVDEGQTVERGELIGQMGRTGRASGVHLHFEIRKNREPVDPLPLLPIVQGVRPVVPRVARNKKKPIAAANAPSKPASKPVKR